jgi:hypothetical protein
VGEHTSRWLRSQLLPAAPLSACSAYHLAEAVRALAHEEGDVATRLGALVGQGAGTQRLARPWRPVKEDASRWVHLSGGYACASGHNGFRDNIHTNFVSPHAYLETLKHLRVHHGEDNHLLERANMMVEASNVLKVGGPARSAVKCEASTMFNGEEQEAKRRMAEERRHTCQQSWVPRPSRCCPRLAREL